MKKRKSIGRWPSKGTMWNRGTKIRNKGQLLRCRPMIAIGKYIMKFGEKEYI